MSNGHRKFEKFGIIHDDLDNIKSHYYNRKVCYYTIKSYNNLGKSIAISILDLFEKNPYSRIPNSVYKDLNGLKSQIREQLNKNNKDFKIYSTKLAPTILNKPNPPQFERSKINHSSLVGKSLVKKNIRSEKGNKSEKNIDGKRRQTLPKMKTHKM